MLTTEEVYEDVDAAMWLGLTPEQIAHNEAQEQAEREVWDRLSEWENHTLREVKAQIVEMEEGDKADNFPLLSN